MDEPHDPEEPLEGVQILRAPPLRRVKVLLDESMNPFRMVAATVLEHSYSSTETRIDALAKETEGAYYLDDLPSYERHKRNAFHATEDPVEVRNLFTRLLASIGPARIFILYTNGRRRPDIGPLQTIAILYRELVRTVLQSIRTAEGIEFIFENHQELNRHFPRIVASGARTIPNPPPWEVSIGHKQAPHALAISDYAMHILSAWLATGRAEDPEMHQYRNWRAIRRSISMVRSLEEGTIIRRGLPFSR